MGNWAFIIVVLVAIQGINADIFTDYEKCRDEENFGQQSGSLVCDYGHTLSNQTIEKLENLLMELQKKISCECPGGCKRAYTGLLHVTSTDAIKEAGVPLNESAKKIYEDAKLGDHTCENGLLILYSRDNQQLATYRGERKFAQLDSDKLHKLATKTQNGGNTTALEFLLSNYHTPEEQPLSMERSEVQRADAWPSVLGLVVALVLILFILAILLAFLLARCCPFCRRGSGKKDKYYVNPVPRAKSTEPIYIYTPPLSDRSPRGPVTPRPRDQDIYSSAYSGTPLPPSVFDPSKMPPLPSRSRTPRSTSLTPVSGRQNRIHPITNGSFKQPETPQLKPREQTSRPESISSKQKQGTLPRSKQPSLTVDQPSTPIPPTVPPHAGPSGVVTPSSPKSPRLPGSVSPVPVDGVKPLPTAEFPFLDPLRKLETQTKEDYIY